MSRFFRVAYPLSINRLVLRWLADHACLIEKHVPCNGFCGEGQLEQLPLSTPNRRWRAHFRIVRTILVSLFAKAATALLRCVRASRAFIQRPKARLSRFRSKKQDRAPQTFQRGMIRRRRYPFRTRQAAHGFDAKPADQIVPVRALQQITLSTMQASPAGQYMVGLVTASAKAAAATVSLLFDFTLGFTNRAANMRALCPISINLQASHYEPGHATMPIRGLAKTFGLTLSAGKGLVSEQSVRRALPSDAVLHDFFEGLLSVLSALKDQRRAFDRQLARFARVE